MYFKDAKVGDKVWDYVYGEGVIGDIFNSGVEFEVSFNHYINIIEYHISGAYSDGEINQRLFYYDNRPIVITQDDLNVGNNSIWGITEEATLLNDCQYSSFKNYSSNKYTRKVQRDNCMDKKESDIRDLSHRISKLERIIHDIQ